MERIYIAGTLVVMAGVGDVKGVVWMFGESGP